MFRSTDGDVTWTAATTQPANLSIVSLAASSTTLPAGTACAGVWRSPKSTVAIVSHVRQRGAPSV